MIGRIFTVGGYTLLSRITGFARDIMLAAFLGAGPVADAFFVALRLPNHFRAIFAEGAFNAAFVPAYAHIRSRRRGVGEIVRRPHLHAAVRAQIVLLVLALAVHAAGDRHPGAGFSAEPSSVELAIALTRITFPYLLLITLVTL